MDILIKEVSQDTANKIEKLVAEQNEKQKDETVSKTVGNLRKDIAIAYAKFLEEWNKIKNTKPFNEDLIDRDYENEVGK